MTEQFVKVEGLSKSYPSSNGKPAFTVFENLNLEIGKGEFVSVIGQAGCGKSTILNMLAGLDKAGVGRVSMNGEPMPGLGLECGLAYRNCTLRPRRSILKSITSVVRTRWPGWRKHVVHEHSMRFLELLGLGAAAHREPAKLSEGMRQRASIALAFAAQPGLLLMDEPFGMLDAPTRGIAQEALIKLCNETRQTVLMITHDIGEAILLSDTILLMTNGPYARVAESVKVSIPRPRSRTGIIHHPDYYRIRNHLLDFLINRSREPAGMQKTQVASGRDAHAFGRYPVSEVGDLSPVVMS